RAVAGVAARFVVPGRAFQGGPAGTGPGSLASTPIVCVGAYIVFFAFSLGPIVWLMISEIYPLRNRAQAMAVSTASNWGANFMVSMTFPIMTSRLGPVATWFTYATFGALTLLFVIAQVPATRGKAWEEISKLRRYPATRRGGARKDLLKPPVVAVLAAAISASAAATAVSAGTDDEEPTISSWMLPPSTGPVWGLLDHD